jgi:AcrR family transcriptional regulator
MREMTVPESGPKRKLLDIAEQLLAVKGFEGVSVRDITQAAKTNVASVNYHFGSRDGLLSLVMHHHVLPLNEERLARLETIDRKGAGKSAALEEIIDAWVRPLVNPTRHSALSEQSFHQLVGRIFSMQNKDLPAAIHDSIQQVTNRFIRSFAKALPTVVPEDLNARFHFMTGGLIHLLLNPPSQQSSTIEATLGRFIRFAAAGLREGTEAEAPAKKGPQATFDF